MPYYKNTGRKWPNFPYKNNYAVRWTGTLKIKAAGVYHFATLSDDGSKLWINGKQVVNNDGLHAWRRRDGKISLTAGHHVFKAEMFERGGHHGISILYKGPDTKHKHTAIPPAAFGCGTPPPSGRCACYKLIKGLDRDISVGLRKVESKLHKTKCAVDSKLANLELKVDKIKKLLAGGVPGAPAPKPVVPDRKWDLSGAVDFELSVKTKTKKASATLVAKAFKDGLWKNGRTGQGKLLFLRGGKLSFDIGWVGVISCSKPVNDGQWHDNKVTFSGGKYHLFTDGVECGSGLRAIPDHPDTAIVTKIAVGHRVSGGIANGDMSQAFAGELKDLKYTKATTPAPNPNQLTMVVPPGATNCGDSISSFGGKKCKYCPGNFKADCFGTGFGSVKIGGIKAYKAVLEIKSSYCNGGMFLIHEVDFLASDGSELVSKQLNFPHKCGGGSRGSPLTDASKGSNSWKHGCVFKCDVLPVKLEFAMDGSKSLDTIRLATGWWGKRPKEVKVSITPSAR